MFKNVASQKAIFFAFDVTTGLPKSGDAANITPYVSKDYGAVTGITDTSMTEFESTNAKGYYHCDLTQSETNADTLMFTGKSSTGDVVVVGVPSVVFTCPPFFTTFSLDSSGRTTLAPAGLDAITTTAPSGVAANFREMVVQLWRRFFRKVVYDQNANFEINYADDGTTPVTTQTLTSVAGVQTQGPAS